MLDGIDLLNLLQQSSLSAQNLCVLSLFLFTEVKMSEYEGALLFLRHATIGREIPHLALELRMIIWRLMANSRPWTACTWCGRLFMLMHIHPNVQMKICTSACSVDLTPGECFNDHN